MLYEKPAVMTSDMVVVPVLEGDSVTRVLGRLAQAGVEVPIWQAKLLTRLEPTLVRKIHVGRFRFTRGMTPAPAASSITRRTSIKSRRPQCGL